MSWGSYYLFWLAAPLVLSLIVQHPVLIGLALVAFLGRRWLPDPFLALKYGGRIASLRTQIEANPHNATARRELALIYLEKRRPAKAIAHLEVALEREPESADLLFHHGKALLGAGRWQEAVDRFVAAVTRDPRIAYGDPYLGAGDALVQLGRLEDAEEAYGRVVEINASSVEARAKLGMVRAARGDREQARAAFMDARSTYRQLPAFRRRKTWWWALRAWWNS